MKKTKRQTRKPTGRKLRRMRLDGRIASAQSPHQKMRLALYGRNEAERDLPLVKIARDFHAFRQLDFKKVSNAPSQFTAENGVITSVTSARDMYLAEHERAKERLYLFALQAMLHWQPKALEALAAAMRRVAKGEFDPQPDKARVSLLHRHQQGTLNVQKLAAELAPEMTNPDKDTISSMERTLRRIKKRILPRPGK